MFIAITIVALGTTLPDILGARMVTCAEEHADGALIHISGSIAVNVLIGVGVPWFVAALWHEGKVSYHQVLTLIFIRIQIMNVHDIEMHECTRY